MQSFTDFVRNTPCAREGFLYGIGIGTVAGILRFYKKGSIASANMWAVSGFAVGAVVIKKLCGFQQAQYHAKMQTLLVKQLNPNEAQVKGFEKSAGTQAVPTSNSEPK
ncbi:hypothetical protein BX070DRAFT_63394 [Coemansia spiralis]|nr:hypothetical protein BX070DRAFT_63394 [Coemansia spiralis]